MKQKTLKKVLFRSFVPVLVNCISVLSLSLIVILLLQKHTSSIVNERIPITEASANFVLSIDNCISGLRRWVLTGEENHSGIDNICEKELQIRLSNLEKISPASDQTTVIKLKELLVLLRRSIWHVVNISHTPGNIPSRLIYERNLLPIYHRIQRALIGITSIESVNAAHGPDISLSISTSHQTLSEAVRRLSSALSSGEVFEIKEFRRQAEISQQALNQLKLDVQYDPKRFDLVQWLDREYQVYSGLAERSLDLRQSADWNRGIYVLRTETEPLTYEIRGHLNRLKLHTAKDLQSAAQRSVNLTWIVVIGLLLSIAFMGLLAMRSSRSIAKEIDQKIGVLSTGASLIGQKPFKPIQLSQDSPLELISLANDINLSATTIDNKTQELNQVILALKAYSQVISHDIKAPIINIRGYVTVLKEIVQPFENHQKQDMNKEDVKELVAAIDFLDISITKIQKFASRIIENSRFLLHQVERTDIDLEIMIKSILDLFSFGLYTPTVRIQSALTIQSDPFLIEHILINLIDNAIKYAAPERQLELSINAFKKNNELIIAVKDNGIGIETSFNLTEPFVQGEGSQEGYGLGLALTVSMAEQLGGKLTWANNVDGEGAEFCVYLALG